MTSLHEDVAAQLADELAVLVHGLSALADVSAPNIDAAADRLAAQILSGDDKLAAQTVIDLAAVLGWDVDDADWWRTPLGQAVAASVGHPDAQAVSQSVAGAMLGVTQQRVSALLREGKLDGAGTGVTVTSIRQRLQDRR